MAGPKKTHLKFLGTLFGLLLFGLAVIAVLSSGIPARLGLQAIWEKAYFHLGNVAVSPELLVETSVFLILLALLTRFSRQFLRNEVLKHTALDQGQRYAIERTFGYAVFALGLFVGMQIIGLNVSSLAFLGGAVGIGVGLGLQNIASNFASGLILLFERPIKVGDRIEVGNLDGDVVRIGAGVRGSEPMTI